MGEGGVQKKDQNGSRYSIQIAAGLSVISLIEIVSGLGRVDKDKLRNGHFYHHIPNLKK